MLEVIPAIDLRDGKCVRLQQGVEDSVTQYSDDPVSVAQLWEREGARRLHIVNLDGAFGRASGNLEVLRRIRQHTGVTIEYGGGIRSRAAIQEALKAGADKVVLGTIAVEHPSRATEAVEAFGGERIIVALDTVGGKVAARGWKEMTPHTILHLARDLASWGVQEVLYTDITRDGMMRGPDLETLRDIAHVGVNVLASGGVSSIEDVFAVKRLNERRVSGVIIGRALYEKKIDLKVLLERLRSET